MSKLRKILKWGFVSLLSVFAVVAIAWAISRAMYPTAEQREAIETMESRPGYEGENAFALLWSLDRDVPASELEQVLAEDVRRFSETPLWPDRGEQEQDSDRVEDDYPRFDSVRADYPDLSPSSEDRRMFCGERDEDCLEKVRQDPSAYNALIERNRALLDRVARLHDYEFIRSPFPPRMAAPMPRYQSASFLRTRHAVEFANGAERQAVAAVCRDIRSWRRLSASSDSLIDRLYGAENATDHNGALLANMLAEWPVDEPLPQPCDSALAPPGLADVSLCNAMRGEFARVAFSVRSLGDYHEGTLDRLMVPLLIDTKATVGLSAEHYEGYCNESRSQRLLADRQPALASQPSILRFDCVGNFYGCFLSAIAEPGYTRYEDRTLDHGARLHVLGTLAWMRQQAGGSRSPMALLRARPDDLKSPEREIGFGPEGRTLQVPLYQAESGPRSEPGHWSIPLPPALHRTPGG